ncbi:MAG: glycosyltransferase family 39 protein [bacterium]|nr:glycosyltransferase family 39 protein [bacterium]
MKLFERVRHESVIIAVIVLVVVGARLLSFAYLSSLASENPSANPYPIVVGDSLHYAQRADNLLAFHAYEDVPGTPLRAAPPGYPVLLAGIKVATGSMTPVVILQTLISILASVLIYRMARTLVPISYALVPALLYAIDPMVVFSDTAVITDSIFSALLVCTVYLAFFQSRVRGIVLWGSVGLLLGAATMIRPIAQFLVFVFPAVFLLRQWMSGRGEDENRLKAVCACVLAFALVVVPWMARNQILFRSFEVSILSSHTLLIYDVRGFLAWRALGATPNPLSAILVMRRLNDPVFASVDKDIGERLAEITPPGEDPYNYKGKLAIRYIIHDPIRYAYFHAVNTIPFFLSSSIASYGQIESQLRNNEGFFAPVTLSILETWNRIRNPESVRSFLSAVWSLAPTALEIFLWVLAGLAAFAAAVLRRRDFTIILFAVLVMYFAALTGPLSSSRYRIPAEPYLLILASVGAHALVERIREKMI